MSRKPKDLGGYSNVYPGSDTSPLGIVREWFEADTSCPRAELATYLAGRKDTQHAHDIVHTWQMPHNVTSSDICVAVAEYRRTFTIS